MTPGLSLVAWLLACTSTPAPEAPPPEAPASDPFTDVDDYTPMVAPPEMIARFAPPPDDGTPAPTPATAPSSPPNVVLVMVCSTRKSELGPYGGLPGLTPHLDAIAASGTLFTDAIAAAPWTRAASTAILTGRHALELGLVEPTDGRNEQTLPDDVPTLASRFHDAGYLTIGNTANPNLDADYGYDRGFERYQANLPLRPKTKVSGVTVVDALGLALWEARKAGDERPVYLQTILVDPHAPRKSGEERWGALKKPGEPARMAQYRFHVSELDRSLVRLDEILASQGLTPDNTLLVVIGDHGEGLNIPAHHGFGHGQYLVPSVVQVPWILRGPGIAAGHVVTGVASQIDLPGTLLALAGVDPGDMPGVRHVDAIRGMTGRSTRPHAIVDTWFSAANRAGIVTPTTTCVHDFGSTGRQRQHKLHIDGCFDRIADPAQTTPIPTDGALWAELLAWRAARPVRAGRAAPADAERAEQLELLGYAEGDEDE